LRLQPVGAKRSEDEAMDGQQFDAFTRAFAGRVNRRLLLQRGAALTGAIGALGLAHPASAARRGDTGGSTSICAPDGGGGYYRTSVPTVLLQTYLNSGYIVSSCCAHAECGETNDCMSAYCDLGAGACSVSYANGAACARPGCTDGYCSAGLCQDPTPMVCAGDGYCNDCVYDACNHHCDCQVQPCYAQDWQCSDSYCDPSQAACVSVPLNEGSPCDTNGVAGTCVMGFCTTA
jgi:hypothetical protein